jgi:hypothetical protein
MQMAAFFSETRGLLVHTTDPRGSVTDWEILPGDRLRIHFYGPEVDVNLIEIPPTVEAAASAYREWAVRQAWAAGPHRPLPRLDLIATASTPELSAQSRVLQPLLDAFPNATAAWLTQWRRHAFDTMYPDYEPRSWGDFYESCDALRRRNCAVLPYVNALLWDIHLKAWIGGQSVAIRNQHGAMVKYSHKLPSLHYACPASSLWQSVMSAALSKIQAGEQGAAGVYLDMALAAPPILCFAEGHGHALGDPFAWQTGVRSLLKQARGLVMSEGCAEIYLNDVDLPLMHLYAAATDTVPLWLHVYGERTPGVGWAISPSASEQEFLREVQRAVSFGAAALGSPWLHHVFQERLMTPEYKDTLRVLQGICERNSGAAVRGETSQRQ